MFSTELIFWYYWNRHGNYYSYCLLFNNKKMIYLLGRVIEELWGLLGSYSMGYLKCKECSGIYELQEGESPDDFDVCYCGGEIEYHLSRDELKKRQVNVPIDKKIAKKKSSDRTILLIIIIAGVLILMALPALLIYRAYFG